MFKVTKIDSNGRETQSFTARDEAHANRLRQRVRETFKQGSSEQVEVTKK